MSRKPERRIELLPLRFFVFKPFGFWRRHVVMYQFGEHTPVPFLRFWLWDTADDYADELNQFMRGREKLLFGRFW